MMGANEKGNRTYVSVWLQAKKLEDKHMNSQRSPDARYQNCVSMYPGRYTESMGEPGIDAQAVLVSNNSANPRTEHEVKFIHPWSFGVHCVDRKQVAYAQVK